MIFEIIIAIILAMILLACFGIGVILIIITVLERD
jgi:hypothetical protein